MRRLPHRCRLVRAGMLVTALMTSVQGCFDLSGPEEGAASIGAIRAAWPSVVLGDTLRDSTGAIAPLRIAVFDAKGDTLRDAQVQWAVVGDSVRAFAIDAASRVIGLSIRSGPSAPDTVVALLGRLQAPKLILHTVPRPDFVTRPAADIAEQRVTVAPNDTSPKATTAPLTVNVWHRLANGDSAAVPAWVVSYEVVEQPLSSDGLPLAFLAAGSARSTRDTTDAQGAAGRTLLVRAHRMSQQRDTVVVRARVVHRGVELPGVSTLEFRVPLLLGVTAGP